MTDAASQIEAANAVISTTALLLRAERDTFERFLAECRHMDSVGHVLDPTLFMSSERRATEAVLKPLYEAALDFLRAYDEQIAKVHDGLAKVRD